MRVQIGSATPGASIGVRVPSDDAPGFAVSTAFDIDAVPALFLVEDGEVTRAWAGWNAEKAAELTDHLTAVTGVDAELAGLDALPPFRPG